MKIRFYFICLLIISAGINSCKRDVPLYTINNLNGNKVSCFGNAGMGIGFKYPINSYESVEPCFRIGADGTELDVQVTQDSVLVAYHDADLSNSTTCSGVINDNLWSSMWGCHYPNAYSSTINLVSVDDLYSKLDNASNYVYTFDCKQYTSSSNLVAYENQFVNAIIKFKNDHHLGYDQVLVESQDSTFLRILKNKDSNFESFIYPTSFEQGLSIAEKMNLWGITIDNTKINTEQVKIAHDKGFRVTLWNLDNAKDNNDAIYKSPDYIQSDYIIHLLKVFGKYKG